jgi:hypothetical protein
MTSIQGQQPAQTVDHTTNQTPNQTANQTSNQTAKTARSAAKGTRAAANSDAGAAFSSMFAASQRKLQADKLAAQGDEDIEEAGHRKSSADDNSSDDDTYATATQTAPVPQNDSSQGQAGQGGSVPTPTAFAAPIQAGAEESPDWLSLASLLPEGADDGVFEVIMPNSAKVGVAVSDQPAGVSYLLTPADDLLASRLRSHEMELAGYLKRRIRRSVTVTVL